VSETESFPDGARAELEYQYGTLRRLRKKGKQASIIIHTFKDFYQNFKNFYRQRWRYQNLKNGFMF